MALNDLDLAGQRAVAEVNQRIGVDRARKPLTPEQLESYRPAKADPTVRDTSEVKELALLLGYIAGPNFEHKLQVARYILSLEKRIAALETSLHINPAQIGVERR